MATEGAEGDLDAYRVGGRLEAVEEGKLKQSRAEQSTSEQSIAGQRRAHPRGEEEAGDQLMAVALGRGELGTRDSDGPDDRGADVARRWSGRPIQMTRRRRCRPAAPLEGKATRGDDGPDPDDPAKSCRPAATATSTKVQRVGDGGAWGQRRR